MVKALTDKLNFKRFKIVTFDEGPNCHLKYIYVLDLKIFNRVAFVANYCGYMFENVLHKEILNVIDTVFITLTFHVDPLSPAWTLE